MTSFGSRRRNTDQSLKVSISSYRQRSDLVRCGNSSGETVVTGETLVMPLNRTDLDKATEANAIVPLATVDIVEQN